MPATRSPDRAVGPHPEAARGERVLELVAEPSQHLELEVAILAARRAGCRRSRATPSAGCARPPRPGRRVGRRAAAGERLEVPVAVGLDLEHRGRPAVLAGLDELVVPVGALDEPDGQRRRSPGRPRPLEDPLEQLGRVAQVSLEHHPRRRARRELVLGQHLEHELEHRLARVERLHVDVDVGAELVRAAQQRPQARGGVASSELGRVGTEQRGERRDLDRDVRPRDRTGAVALEHVATRASRAAHARAR